MNEERHTLHELGAARSTEVAPRHELGENPTGLTTDQLKNLGTLPDLWEKDLSHGMNSDVYLLKGAEYVVKLSKPERKNNPLQANAAQVAEAMFKVNQHPLVESILYAYDDHEASILISKFKPDLQQLSHGEKKAHLLFEDGVLEELVESLLYLDKQGVLQKDLCEWDILFDKNTNQPFILDFDKVRTIDWQVGNISLEQLALGFERDNSTLRPEVLNIDDLQENFIMEACVFYFENDQQRPDLAFELFERFLVLQRDQYCPQLQAYFAEINRADLADAIGERQKKLSEWLASKTKLQVLYLRKRMHFVFRALNWARQVREDNPRYDLKDFMLRIVPWLEREATNLRRQAEFGVRPLYPDPALYDYKTAIDIDNLIEQPLLLATEKHTLERVSLDISNIDEIKNNFPILDSGVRLTAIADTHGKLSKIARIGEVVSALRQHSRVDSFVSLGDNVEGGSEVAELFAAVEMLNLMGIEASALGNHEFDYHDTDYTTTGLNELKQAVMTAMANNDPELPQLLQKLQIQVKALQENASVLAQGLRQAEFKTICSNLNYENGSSLHNLWERQEIIPGALTEINGQLFLYLSVTTPDLEKEFNYHRQRGFDSSVSVNEHPVQAILLHQIRQVKAKYPNDQIKVVVLSHGGLPLDRQLAHPEIDLILGAHTHNIVHEEMIFADNKRTHLIHAGQNGQFLSVVNLELDEEGGFKVKPNIIDIENSQGFPSESPFRTALEKQQARGETIGVLAEALSIEGKSIRSTPLMRFITDAVKNNLNDVDLFMTFGGNVRESLMAGEITTKDLKDVLPYDNQVHVLTLQGSQIRDILDYMVKVSRVDSGKRSLLLHFSGLSYRVDADGLIAEVNVITPTGILPLSNDQEYRLALPDFMLTGLGQDFPLTELVSARTVSNESVGATVRELIRREIANQEIVRVDSDEGRIVIDPQAPLTQNSSEMVY